MIGDLSCLWDELEVGAQATGITARRLNAHAPVDIFVGIEVPGPTRLVFIQAPASALGSWGAKWPQSAGFTVALETSAEATGRPRLVVRLTAPSYQDVFSVLVRDLLNVIERSVGEDAAIRAFATRLQLWQQLLSKHGAEGLTLPEQRGLYGELMFLRDHALAGRDAPTAIGAWAGPLAKDQDFQFSGCTVEVKVSTANPAQVIHVSNVRQLDEAGSDGRPLFLFFASLEERNQQGESLVAIVKHLREVLGAHAAEFNERLLLAGYLDVHGPRYSNNGYVVKAVTWYEVTGEFPSIKERELRHGVGDVRYTIALGACSPFLVEGSTVSRAIGENP